MRDDIEIDNSIAVEWMILADYVEVVGGKLYLMGGGWEAIENNGAFPMQRTVGIAVALRVPWNRTNEQHQLAVEIQDDDAQEVLATLSGQFEAGRPAGVPRGQPQRAQLAVNLNMHIAKPGGYTIVTNVNGEQLSHTPFQVR